MTFEDMELLLNLLREGKPIPDHLDPDHKLRDLLNRPTVTDWSDTMNVQGRLRDVIEDSLIAAGFYLPYHATERWYRDQLENTGIQYGMVLGRPHVLGRAEYPPGKEEEYRARDREILNSFTAEYEARQAAEEESVKAITSNPETIVAHVIYPTG